MAGITRQFSSSALISRYVRYFFHSRPYRNSIERVTPNGTILVSFRLQPDSFSDNVYVSSRFNKTRFVNPAELGEVIGVCFYPWAARPFFKIPLNRLTDKKLPLDDILGNEIKLLYEEVLSSKSFTCAVKAIESYLDKILSGSPEPDWVVADASCSIVNSAGSVQLSRLPSKYGVSERRLQQRFSEELGASPKTYSRLIRFQAALKLLGTEPSLTAVSYKCGYFDQSHFIRDFKMFTGITPTRYLAEKHSIDDIYSTAPPLSLFKTM